MSLDRMTCPTCGRPNVAFRLIRPPRVNRGKPIPGIRVPVRHKRWKVDQEPPLDWCEAGQP